MTTKTIEIHDLSAYERRMYTGLSLTPCADHAVDVHEEYCFLPVDTLPPGNSPMTIMNQLSAAFNSPYVRLDIIDAGFDHRLSIRITYEVEGPDPENEEAK